MSAPRPDMVGNQWAFKSEGATKWAHYKRMQKLVPAGPCAECGGPGQVIHHKDHDPLNTVPSNLERQCRSCHVRHHDPRGWRQRS